MARSVLEWTLTAQDRASDKFDKVARSSDRLGRMIRRTATVGVAALGALAVASAGLAVTSVKAYAEAEQAQAKLSFAYERFPALAQGNIDALRELNTELMRKTRFDDDALATGQATLAQYGLTQKQLEDITPLLADYAARTGKDLPNAAQDLGKAILGQGRALKNVGIDFKDTGSAAGNFEQIMAGLRTQVGGFAERDALTVTGQLERLKNGFGEVQESIGVLFVPALGTINTTVYEKVLPALERIIDKVGPRVEEFFSEAAYVIGEFAGALADASDGDTTALDRFFDTLEDRFPALGFISEIFEELRPLWPELSEGFQRLGEALTEEGVMDALVQLVADVLPPLVGLLVALAPVIPPVADALTKSLVPALGSVTGDVESIIAVWDLLTGKITGVDFMNKISSAGGWIAGFARGLAGNIVGIYNVLVGYANGVVKNIIDTWNGLMTILNMPTISVPQVKPISLTFLNGGVQGSSSLGSFDTSQRSGGNTWTGGMPVGVPADRVAGGRSSNVNFNVTVNGVVGDRSAVAKSVTDALVKATQSGSLSNGPLRKALGIG